MISLKLHITYPLPLPIKLFLFVYFSLSNEESAAVLPNSPLADSFLNLAYYIISLNKSNYRNLIFACISELMDLMFAIIDCHCQYWWQGNY